MAKVKVNFDVKNTTIITETIAKQMGRRAVSMAKKMIANGVSPVAGGKRRFPGYAATRKTESLRRIKKNLKSKKARAAARALQVSRERGQYPLTVRDKYPGKKVRPVNLSLNGWYLDHLTWWIADKRSRVRKAFRLKDTSKNKTVSVGFSATTGQYSAPPKEIKDYFATHNEGKHPHVPQRKHLPTRQGEKFASSIMREMKKIIERRVKNMVIAENNRTRNKK